ncbi:MAG TPA: hypothetical protein VFX48_08205, partial [Saprospiraceae bacterium]|nr:hypothetical protein [Saprospiraceae bacterium]
MNPTTKKTQDQVAFSASQKVPETSLEMDGPKGVVHRFFRFLAPLFLISCFFHIQSASAQFTSSMTASPASVRVGGIITYTISISGITTRQNNIKIDANIPANTAIVPGSVVNVSGQTMTIPNTSDPYWTRDSLIAGQTTMVRFMVTVLPTNSTTPIANTATAMSDMETDNLSVNTTFVPPVLQSTACVCNNDQTPNNTDGTYSTTLIIKNDDNTLLPSGLTYTIVSSTGLLNTAKGPLGTPVFIYCNGAGCPTGVNNGQYYLNVIASNQLTGQYSATVDGPDAGVTADITMGTTTCGTLYPALPVIPFQDKNCLNLGINKFSSSMAVYNINNVLTPIQLPSGFSQNGTDSLMVDNATVLESNNNPVHELYLIKRSNDLSCRVSS